MERNNRGRPRRTTLVIRYQNSEFPNFFLKSPTTYLIPKKRSKWKNHEINGKKAEILWKIEKQESLKRDPRVPLRGQKEKFTLNSAARTLRIRVHSNEPSHPCRPVNIFFRASVCVCFFQPPRGGARSMQSDLQPFPRYPPRVILFFFCSSSPSTHWPLCLLFLVLFFLLPIQQNPRRNYAGFSSGDTGRGAGNKTKPGVTRCSRKKGVEILFFRTFPCPRRESNGVSSSEPFRSTFLVPPFAFFLSLRVSSVRRSSAFLWDIFLRAFLGGFRTVWSRASLPRYDRSNSEDERTLTKLPIKILFSFLVLVSRIFYRVHITLPKLLPKIFLGKAV